MSPSGTTDQQEIAKFNRLASTWWSPEGPMWPLHLLNQFRVKLILEVLSGLGTVTQNKATPLQGYRVLDIGCGGGILAEALYKLGADVTGIDMAENNIAIARGHAAQNNLDIRYLCQEVASLDEEFDLVFNMEVVEHVADLESFMLASCEKVRPGGMMFLSTINRTVKSFLFAIIGAEYVLRLLPKGSHQWSKFVSPDEIEKRFHQQGLDTVWTTGVSLNPLTRNFYRTPSMAVNYMVAAKKGVISQDGNTATGL